MSLAMAWVGRLGKVRSSRYVNVVVDVRVTVDRRSRNVNIFEINAESLGVLEGRLF